jgi:predicted small metal-binding protein
MVFPGDMACGRDIARQGLLPSPAVTGQDPAVSGEKLLRPGFHGGTMKKVATFRCQDLGLSCGYEMEAADEMELMKSIEGHIMTAHQMDVRKAEVRERILKILTYR